MATLSRTKKYQDLRNYILINNYGYLVDPHARDFLRQEMPEQWMIQEIHFLCIINLS